MPAEDYTGIGLRHRRRPLSGPLYQDDYQAALDAAGISYDVYDVDANGRTAASALGVLSHYKAVIWETGEDMYVREPGQPGGTGTSKLLDDEILGIRDYLNNGGKALVAGKFALQGGVGPVAVQPARRPAGAVLQEQPGRSQRQRRPAGPALQLRGGVQRLPAVLARGLPADRRRPSTTTRRGAAVPGGRRALRQRGVHGQRRGLRGESGQHLLVPDDVEHPAGRRPTRSSRAEQAIKFDRPPSFDPPTGTHYAFSQAADDSYKRLSRTVDLTGQDDGRPVVHGVLRHRARLGLPRRRGPYGRPGRLDDAARRERAHVERHHGQQQLPADPDRPGAPVHGPLRDAAPRDQSRGGRRDV